ncbi:MAG: hypothetical protein DCF32_04380 [Leptolyngbya sp.]|nr:MAG: hypothetical protein DCF32_04380 [Leptolyngbya sp.]
MPLSTREREAKVQKTKAATGLLFMDNSKIFFAASTKWHPLALMWALGIYIITNSLNAVAFQKIVLLQEAET